MNSTAGLWSGGRSRWSVARRFDRQMQGAACLENAKQGFIVSIGDELEHDALVLKRRAPDSWPRRDSPDSPRLSADAPASGRASVERSDLLQ